MIKWIKSRTRQEKWMLLILLMLALGVIIRWGFIKSEVKEAFKSRIEHFSPHEKKS